MEITAAATTPVVAASRAPDQNHGNGHTAAHRPKHLAYGFQQILGHAGTFQNNPHEGEERNGQQRVVLHDAKDAQGQGLEHRGGEDTRFNTHKTKGETGGGQTEGYRKARQQQGKKAR
jgi:hypothetical protein